MNLYVSFQNGIICFKGIEPYDHDNEQEVQSSNIEQQSSNIGRQINEIQVQPTRRPNSKFRSGRQLDDRPPVQQTQSGDLTIGEIFFKF